MNTHADKTQESKSQSAAMTQAEKQNGSESAIQFEDNRPETIAQRKLKEMVNECSQGSPLRSFQVVENKSSQTKLMNPVNKNNGLRSLGDSQNNTVQRFPIQITQGGKVKALNNEDEFFNLLNDKESLNSEEVLALQTKIVESDSIDSEKKIKYQDALKVYSTNKRVKTFRDKRNQKEHFAERKEGEERFTAYDEVDTKNTTRFKNFFYENRVEMIENYRDAKALGKLFFASDAFFDQLASANNNDTDNSLIERLPNKLPSKIVRTNIDNEETKTSLTKIYGEENGEYSENPDTENFKIVIGTPNGEATVKILDDFNAIQRVREIEEQKITKANVKRANNSWSIEFQIE